MATDEGSPKKNNRMVKDEGDLLSVYLNAGFTLFIRLAFKVHSSVDEHTK